MTFPWKKHPSQVLVDPFDSLGSKQKAAGEDSHGGRDLGGKLRGAAGSPW